MRCPIWFPYPRAWLRALIPAIVFPVVWAIIPYVLLEHYYGQRWAIQLAIELSPLIVWLPIQVVIYVHHWLLGHDGHLMRPGVFSLWEGIYALQVFILAMAGAFLLYAVYMGMPLNHRMPNPSEAELAGIWWAMFTLSAYLYQLEHLVRYSKSNKLSAAKQCKI